MATDTFGAGIGDVAFIPHDRTSFRLCAPASGCRMPIPWRAAKHGATTKPRWKDPPDRPVRPPGHAAAPSANSPDNTYWLSGSDTPTNETLVNSGLGGSVLLTHRAGR